MNAIAQVTIPTTPTGEVVMIHQSAHLRIWRLQGRDRRLVISVNGWGQDLDKPQGPAFVGTCSMNGENTVLFIADTARSYFTQPGILQTAKSYIEAEAARIPDAEIVAFGDSMGGHGALLLCSVTHVDRAVCFAPSVDVTPEVMGAKRYAGLRGRINHPVRPVPISGCDLGKAALFVVFGTNYIDAPHVPRLSGRGEPPIAILPGAPHAIPTWLAKKGRLRAMAEAGITGDVAAWRREVKRSFGVFEPSLPYWLCRAYIEWRWGLYLRFKRFMDRHAGASLT